MRVFVSRDSYDAYYLHIDEPTNLYDKTFSSRYSTLIMHKETISGLKLERMQVKEFELKEV